MLERIGLSSSRTLPLAIVNHDGNVFLAPRDEVVRRREQQRQPQMCRGGGQAGVGYAKAQKYDCFGPPTNFFGDRCFSMSVKKLDMSMATHAD